MVQRDKNLRAYTSTDFVKYFAKKFQEEHKRNYNVVFARDCSIMLKVMRKFHDAKKEFKDIFVFIDKMFVEYPQRRRIKPMDLNWLYSVADIYLSPGKIKDASSNKVKAPAVELSPEMKEWLKKEKEKWLK